MGGPQFSAGLRKVILPGDSCAKREIICYVYKQILLSDADDVPCMVVIAAHLAAAPQFADHHKAVHSEDTRQVLVQAGDAFADSLPLDGTQHRVAFRAMVAIADAAGQLIVNQFCDLIVGVSTRLLLPPEDVIGVCGRLRQFLKKIHSGIAGRQFQRGRSRCGEQTKPCALGHPPDGVQIHIEDPFGMVIPQSGEHPAQRLGADLREPDLEFQPGQGGLDPVIDLLFLGSQQLAEICPLCRVPQQRIFHADTPPFLTF